MTWIGGAIGAVFGAVIGSFLATVYLRWPAGISAVSGGSRCDACGAPIAAGSLVPLLSYILQRGRCVRCTARIDPIHPRTELAAALVGAMAGMLFFDSPAEAIGCAAFGWQLLLLGMLDLGHRWLPDRLNLLLAATGLGFAALGGAEALRDALAGSVAGYLMLAAVRWLYRRLRRREGLGGGDPKMFGAIGAWLGWTGLPWVLAGASFLGLGAAALLAARSRRFPGDLRLPLGSLLALAAWPIWIAARQG